MNELTKMEKLFQVLDESAELLADELDAVYLDALAEAAENLYEGTVLQDVNDLAARKLQKLYDRNTLDQFSKEEKRKAFGLAVLKGMKDATQQNHMVTPDAVAVFIGYLLNKLTENREQMRIFDPALGIGNLLMAVKAGAENKQVSAFGSEVDETLIKLAYMNANWQEMPIELFNQDSLQPLLLDPVDVVVSDLPVGYYPDDARAASFALQADEGHSYAHHLFIEQSLRYTKEGGYLIFLIPNFLFESGEAEKLNRFLKENTHILGLLQLPKSMFKNEQMAKSIFILQKKGKNTNMPKQGLMAEMPSFSNKTAMAGMVDRINRWFYGYSGGNGN
ncbi:class I SAM-dependent methyltransferase [Bacillus marinisedimentorum]|uniref:class I SAM-dependent methyltransferase n=1 Tax=Bacillus marinisedimentorum TaxID=1821260 RepID=UPI000A8C3832|nr:class I SAM-dependent methyltransferase [Bacillus marinisedimentorum]